jgi:hypothetical protein
MSQHSCGPTAIAGAHPSSLPGHAVRPAPRGRQAGAPATGAYRFLFSTARSSCALLIFERPSTPSFFASS